MTGNIADCPYDRMVKALWDIDDGNIVDDSQDLRSENDAMLTLIEKAYDVSRSQIIDDLNDIGNTEGAELAADDELRYGHLDEYGEPIDEPL